LNSLVANPLPTNKLLNVRVRPVIAGVPGPYGPACRLMIDMQPGNCITTALISTPGATQSCGVTGKSVKGSGHAGKLYAQPAVRVINGMNQAANRYAFELKEPITGYTRYAWTTGYTLLLSKWTTAPLLCGTHTYQVRVMVSFDSGATWCPWGGVCTVEITNNQAQPFCTIPGTPMAPGNDRMFEATQDEDMTEPVFTLWPNPTQGGRLNMLIEGLETEVTTATVDLHDLFGKRVGSWTIPVNEGTFNTAIELDNALASGLYTIQVTVGEQVFTKRLVIN
jgi:hypothetical protein